MHINMATLFELFLLRADRREEEDVVGVIGGLVVDEHGAEAVLAWPWPVLDERAPEVLEQPARRLHVAGSVVQGEVAERPSGRHAPRLRRFEHAEVGELPLQGGDVGEDLGLPTERASGGHVLGRVVDEEQLGGLHLELRASPLVRGGSGLAAPQLPRQEEGSGSDS